MTTDRAAARERVHRHPMRVVTRRTGLSAELLRVWERRYGVVTPGRTQTGRRLYSDADIDRLRLLYRATLAGRSIGLVAKLSMSALAALVRQDADAERTLDHTDGRTPNASPATVVLDECFCAIERYDAAALENVLRRAMVALSAPAFLDIVIVSLLEQLGARWRDGTMRPVHEHLATAVIRRILDRVIDAASAPGASPNFVVATPVGQLHELGAMLAAAAAAAEGWAVTYLGVGVPAEDIAEAALAIRAHAVGLSLVYPPNDRAISDELRRLHVLLPKSIPLVTGGGAAEAYGEVLDAVHAERVHDLTAFRARLRILSRGRARRSGRAARRSPGHPADGAPAAARSRNGTRGSRNR
jgi:MerR family transcriptional regulator, light-induced transcriptional regulator